MVYAEGYIIFHHLNLNEKVKFACYDIFAIYLNVRQKYNYLTFVIYFYFLFS